MSKSLATNESATLLVMRRQVGRRECELIIDEVQYVKTSSFDM